jgi:hypothetical protein
MSSDALTFDETGFPQGTTTSSLHFTYSDSRGIFLPSPLVECFPCGGLSIYYFTKEKDNQNENTNSFISIWKKFSVECNFVAHLECMCIYKQSTACHIK